MQTTKETVLAEIEQRYSKLWRDIESLPKTEYDSKEAALDAIEKVGTQAKEIKILWQAVYILK